MSCIHVFFFNMGNKYITCTCNSLIGYPHPPNILVFVGACKEKGVVVLIRLMLEFKSIGYMNLMFMISKYWGWGYDNFIDYIL